MTEASMMRRVKANRVLSLLMTLVALFGWGAFAYSAHSAAILSKELGETIIRTDADRVRLLSEHAAALEEARAKVTMLEQLLLAMKQPDEKLDGVAETGSIKPRPVSSAGQRDVSGKLRR
jgi:hypothetical protein